jgi:hypothetical protein
LWQILKKEESKETFRASMNKRLIAVSIIVILVLGIAESAVIVSASISISVKKGDWIEYNVVATGNFPGESNAQWARLEIVDVQGDIIHINSTTMLTNGSYVYADVIVNFDMGNLEEGFFVPSNVSVGGVFYDSLVGNITVSGMEQKTYAGAERTVLTGVSPESTFVWDKTKGILVEAHSSYPEYNFTYDTIVNKTNMWTPQILGLEPDTFYILISAAALAIVVVVALILIWHKRKSQ